MNRAEREHIRREIARYRTACLAHRYLYYVKAEPIITDFAYDVMERKLKALVEAHPDIASAAPYESMCPLIRPGSDLLDDYPRHIEMLAESLLAYAQRIKNK